MAVVNAVSSGDFMETFDCIAATSADDANATNIPNDFPDDDMY